MKKIGFDESISFELSEFEGEPELCLIDIRIADKKITERDNVGFIPALRNAIEYDLKKKRDLDKFQKLFEGKSLEDAHRLMVKSRTREGVFGSVDEEEIFSEHQIFDWASLTDDVFSFVFKKDEKEFVTLSFIENDKDVFFTEIKLRDLEGYLKTLASNLDIQA